MILQVCQLAEGSTWRTVAEVDFNDGRTAPASVLSIDERLVWSIEDACGQFSGSSSDTRWKGNHIILPISDDSRARLEVSGDFRIPKSDGYQLIALWGIIDDGRDTEGPLCLYFEGEKGQGQYIIQTRWMKMPVNIVGKRTFPGFGDETYKFHRMRMILDRSISRISYFVDEKMIGEVTFHGVIPPIIKLQMDIETPYKGTNLKIQFDNLRARSSGPAYDFQQKKKPN
jgi:hypothetical protein